MKNEEKTKEQLIGELLELHNREEWYRVLYEENPSTYFTLDSEEKVLSVNSFGAEQLGYTVEELVGQSILRVIYEEDRKILLGQIAACLVNPGSTTSQELRTIRRDGNIRWVKEAVRSVRAADGRIIILIVCEDITRLKQAEQELRGSEVNYRNLVENVRDIIFTISSDFTITSLNPAFETITGWQREQWIGKDLRPLVHPDDLPLAMEIYRRVLDGEVPPSFELRILSKSGDYIITEYIITPQTQDERIISALGIARDITQRKHAEEALHAAESRFRILVEQSLVGIYITQDDKILYVNPKLAEMLGYTQEEIVTSKSVSDLIAEEDRDRAIQYIRKRMRGEIKSMHHTFRGLRKNGTLIDFEVYGTRIELNGRPAVMGVAIDITERKRAEEELQRAHDELEKRIKERTAELTKANQALKVEIAGRRRIEEQIKRSEEKYKNIVELTTNIIYTSDRAGNQVFMNSAGYRLLETTPEEVLGKPWLTWIHTDDREKTLKKLMEMIEQDVDIFDFENRYVSRSGRVIHVLHNVRVIRDEKGEITGTQGIARDITEHKKAEEQLRFQTTVLSQVNDAVIAFDNKHHIIYWNDGAQRLYGFNSEEVLGRQVEEVTRHQWLKPEDEKEAYSSLESTGSWRGEFVQARKSGEEIDVEASIRVLRDERGGTLGFIAVMRDITERKQVEEKLSLLASLVESSDDAIIGKSLDATIISWNLGAQKVFGYSFDEVRGRSISIIVPADRPDEHIRLLERIRQGQRIKNYETVRLRKDGRRIDVSLTISPIKDAAGRIIGSSTIARDITERKRIEQRLSLLSAAVEEAPDGIQIVDMDGQIIFSNKAVKTIYGFSPEEYQGKHVNEMNADPELASKIILPAIKETGRWIGEVMVKHKDGRMFPILLNASVIKGSSGEPIAMMGIITDITERKRAEEEHERWADELARSNAELEQFAYIASHDLQEPLRMVSGFTQLLAKRYRGRLDKDADEFISYTVDGTARMQRIIEDLLAYSRVGTRGRPFEQTDCEDIFNQAVTNLKVAIEENKATVTHDPLPTVMADPTQIGQLLQNLISNAIKFRKKDEPPRIHISARRRGGEWVFSVRDNGIGISPEFRSRLFQIFQREHAASEYKGTGIGLAICKKIVERHGGRIWAESEPGKGSTFHFTMSVRKSR